MELSRQGKTLEQTVGEVLAMWHSALNTYGRPLGGSMVQAWLIALGSARIVQPELMEAAAHFLTEREDFPTPSEVIDWVRSMRDRREAEARLELTRREIAKESERYRQALIQAGIDPDALVPASLIREELSTLAERASQSLPARRRERAGSGSANARESEELQAGIEGGA